MTHRPASRLTLRRSVFGCARWCADATSCWQAWSKDPEDIRPLNAPLRGMPLDYLANYAGSFDKN